MVNKDHWKLGLGIFCFAIFTSFTAVGLAQGPKEKDLSALAQEYFSKADYDGFYQYVEASIKEAGGKTGEAYYYLALTRSKEIESWKKTKNWAGVYDKAPAYKKDILENLDKAQTLIKDDPAALLDIKYLKWLCIRQDDPDSAVGLFNDLVNSAQGGTQSPATLERVKAFGDELSSLEDKSLSRRLYEVYVNKLISSGGDKEGLKGQAEKFLKEGNAYLAKSLFAAYVAKIADNKELMARELVAIANRFANDGRKEALDPVYAEEMYKKAYETAGSVAFDAASQYGRAFNLERLKEFRETAIEYKHLLDTYPDYAAKQNVYFRLAVLSAYAEKNIIQAQEYFLKVKDEFPKNIVGLESLYQMGLLAQAQGQSDKAKEYYDELLKEAKSQGFDLEKLQLAQLSQERLKEIDAKKELAYGVRLFFQEILKPASPLSVDVTARPAKQDVSQPVQYTVTTSNPQTGCMMPVYSYEWSGEVGDIANIPNAPELTTDYTEGGVKVVGVAVIGPDGPQGVGFEMTEITAPDTKGSISK